MTPWRASLGSPSPFDLGSSSRGNVAIGATDPWRPASGLCSDWTSESGEIPLWTVPSVSDYGRSEIHPSGRLRARVMSLAALDCPPLVTALDGICPWMDLASATCARAATAESAMGSLSSFPYHQACGVVR